MYMLAMVLALVPAAAPAGAVGRPSSSAQTTVPVAKRSWTPGTEVMQFENLEGIILVRATLRGQGHDTTGALVLDSGAGFLALDRSTAARLGIADTESDAPSIASHPLSRLELGALQIDQIEPVITLGMEIVKRVTDRPVLGLLGQHPLSGRAVLVDYSESRVALVPVPPRPRPAAPDAPGAGRADTSRESARSDSQARDGGPGAIAASRNALAGLFSARATAIPFRLAGDGKILVTARVSNPIPPHLGEWLTLIVDTGATKAVFFEPALRDHAPGSRKWRELRGLVAPTLSEMSSTRMVRVPALEVGSGGDAVMAEGIDAAVISGEFPQALARAVGESVHGLLGYSFLKRYRYAIDYPNRVLWLEARPRREWDDRPHEYTQVGIQLERRQGAARVIAVAEGSPAAEAGIRSGDEVVAIAGRSARKSDLLTLSRLLEGPEGSAVRLTTRRGSVARQHQLLRRRLL